ncbi:MAG: hypothetical protein IPJ30_11660 [Acidobacteria bacterium]|nr:hypothetical protein [Acidobacteriota bacterium]
MDAALPDRSIDTKRSSTIRYRRWYRLVPVPNTKNPWVFQSSRFQDSRIPGFQDSRDSRIPGFQDSRIPGFQDSRIPGFQRFQRFQASRDSRIPNVRGIP